LVISTSPIVSLTKFEVACMIPNCEWCNLSVRQCN